MAGRPFLGFPPAWAGVLILLIEAAATLTIGATLVLAYVGGRPTSSAQGANPPQDTRELVPSKS